MIKTDFSNCLTASVDMRAPFFDLDPAGVVWHGRYFQYFELARCALLEGINYSYEDMENSGYLWPVADTEVRFVRPLTLNQKVRVTACLREWEMRIVVDYKIEDELGEIYTKARTVQVPVEADTLALTLGSPQILIDTVEQRLLELGKQSEK
ncbi:MAG: acyl-CoA thioesterase [Gammaproteobacteria bacterium]|nr:acyl-CoA thioesterase [Gammaproteobacteria bacterium]MDH3372030.1 acyl-CoA thioesterase [Gammaproteobacteria bacterium]MDH3407827.1 acyl-CoA thioesterase [Gammaproteobacteria bacterium]MDH3552008.1 acyl-CoA thioesterase [Gammaproteobacteria bacterium]